MKFGKDFERELVPEWRAKYLDYRQGKKKLKPIARAIRNATKTPTSSFKPITPSLRAGARKAAPSSLGHRSNISSDTDHGPLSPGGTVRRYPSHGGKTPTTTAVTVPPPAATESSPLAVNTPRNQPGRMARYGSIIGTPPDSNGNHLDRVVSNQAPSLRLPGPAMGAQSSNASPAVTERPQGEENMRPHSWENLPPGATSASEQRPQSRAAEHLSGMFRPTRTNSTPTVRSDKSRQPFLNRVMTLRPPKRAVTFASQDSVPMEAYKEIEDRQQEFFEFLDSELEKIDTFYREKEQAATDRLAAIREQLHIMRDRRVEEIAYADHGVPEQNGNGNDHSNGKSKEAHSKNDNSKDRPWLSTLDKAVDKAKLGHVGKTFEAMKHLGTPSGPSAIDLYRDYTRKPFSHEVPYRTAKHKLKVALAEYYRGLELLKSYALLNRTAFRKIIKKYDKTVQTQPTGKYMSEKVGKAYFVNSEVIETHIHAVEDLYSRYFERGNRKIAVGKLRAKIVRAGEFSQASFVNGLLLAGGSAFGIEGLVYGLELLSSPNEEKTLQATYLLQLYGGFFLAILLALFFCVACRIWHRSKVNYTFVFEFDTRRQILDWRQLTEIPCVLFFLLGLTIWLNFREFGDEVMFLWWPVVLAGLIVVVLLDPLPILWPKSRQWFLYSLWRLFFAGIYPVEFRDFFMGDLFCSLTYAMGNIEVFFCQYSQRPIWSHPRTCSSLNSRVLGFLACLPGIWRALQCIRRYRDTKNVFPHLVNCGKYVCTILYYMSLSIYRINPSTATKALFILFATVNAIYCSLWDLAMDWSLLDPTAKHKFLRKTLAYKSTWVYYVAMVIDPIVRFNFVLYIFYAEDPKHAALVNFIVAFTEVCRRGMWMTFRVENEHCANVGRFRAYRDAPLPYETKASSKRTSEEENVINSQAGDAQIRDEQAGELEAGGRTPSSPPSAPLSGQQYRDSAKKAVRDEEEQRQRRGQPSNDSPVARALVRAGALIHLAHTQDFERKRKPGQDGEDSNGHTNDHDEESDEDENSDSELEEAEIARARGAHDISSASR